MTDQSPIVEESAITAEMREVAATWQGGPYSFAVERGHIRDFADAIADPNPLWRDPAYARSFGYRDVPAPPAFIHAFVGHHHGHRPPMPRTFKRGFSASDEVETFATIQAGDVLTITARVDGLWEKKGRPGIGRMIFISHVYTYTNQEGTVVGKVDWINVSYEG